MAPTVDSDMDHNTATAPKRKGDGGPSGGKKTKSNMGENSGTGSNHEDNQPLEMQHTQAFGKVDTHTIVVSGSTYIGSLFNTNTENNRWFLFPWHTMSGWLNDEQATELRSKYRYWKMGKVEVAFKNPMCTHEILQASGQTLAQNNIQANIFGYLDDDYQTGITYEWTPRNASTIADFHAMHDSFRTNGLTSGVPHLLPASQPTQSSGINIPVTLFSPGHPNVIQMACGNGKEMSFGWSAYDPYWRVTNEFALNPAYVSGNNQQTYHDGAATFGRWDQACGTIGRNYFRGADGGALEADNIATLCTWRGTNHSSGYSVQALTQVDAASGHYAWTATNNTTDLGDEPILPEMNVYRSPNPMPHIWLSSEALLGSVTTGVANSVVRLHFEYRITLLCKGRIPRALGHRASNAASANLGSTYGYGAVGGISKPIFSPIVPYAFRWHLHNYVITAPTAAMTTSKDTTDGVKIKVAKRVAKKAVKVIKVIADVIADNKDNEQPSVVSV